MENATTEHRNRLLEGMACAVAQKGYADTTIADIVREAAVSRRTFYEHFSDKSACLVALFERANDRVLASLRAAIDPAQPWPDQLEQALAAYFRVLSGQPVLLRTLFIEIFAQGVAGLAARRAAVRQLAALLIEMRALAYPALPALPEPMAVAVVGGINELVLQAIEQGQSDQLQRLVQPAAALVRATAGEQANMIAWAQNIG